MDDSLNDAFGGIRPRTSIEEAWHNEQKRKQYDIIRVKNPHTARVKNTEYTLPANDFYQEYDTNQYQRVPFGTTIDIPRYIAMRYVEHKKDDIVNFVNKKLHDEFLESRDKKGFARYTDKSTENKETYETDSYPKTNDQAIIAELYDQLWVGLVHEFGRDIPPENQNPRSGEVDLTPTAQKVLESMSKKRVDPNETPTPAFQAQSYMPPVIKPMVEPQVSPFSQMNEKLTASEVTASE